jgi:hypothetical protein
MIGTLICYYRPRVRLKLLIISTFFRLKKKDLINGGQRIVPLLEMFFFLQMLVLVSSLLTHMDLIRVLSSAG